MPSRRIFVRDHVHLANGCRSRDVHDPMTREGFEPTASLVLSQGGLPIAYRAMFALMPKAGFEPTNTRS